MRIYTLLTEYFCCAIEHENHQEEFMAKGKTLTISKAELEEAHRAIVELTDPVKESFTLAEAIETMKEDIKAKLDKGHTLETILATLNARGLDISLSKLKSEWRKLYPTRKRRSKKSKAPAFGDGAQYGDGSQFGEGSEAGSKN
jgi:hypothetical protein